MMTHRSKVLLFAGTTEGAKLAQFLADGGVSVLACVATEYGKTTMKEGPFLKVSSGPLGEEGMLKEVSIHQLVVDATHPYATDISEHISRACRKTGAKYMRMVRKGTVFGEGVIIVQSIDEAVRYLSDTEGPILVTTGSKDLVKYARIPGYKTRVYARVLSAPRVMTVCAEMGFVGKNLYMMQGPFCTELDYGMLVQTGAKYMVTKDSGTVGGINGKLEAAKRAGVKVIVVGRPTKEEGPDYEEVLDILSKRFNISCPEPNHRLVILAGIGMGSLSGPTVSAYETVTKADVLIGADRMLETFKDTNKPVCREYLADKVVDFLDSSPQYRNAAILLSGDVGFHSGAKALLSKLDSEKYDVKCMCGISSVQYMCAKMRMSWEDVCMLSAHGREQNIPGEVRRNSSTFIILNSKNAVTDMCDDLMRFGLSNLKITIGKNMGYLNETFVTGTPREIQALNITGLCSAMIENPSPVCCMPIGMYDDEFIRESNIPMTKSEIRVLAVSKLRLCDNSIVYDIGAGTGSVSVEMARCAVNGEIYAVEKNNVAIGLIQRNRKATCTPNIKVVRGTAPEALELLPAPTHVFIGGSSGNLREIVRCVFDKNPRVRIVITAVTLETLSDMTECGHMSDLIQEDLISVNISNSRIVGRYNLMTAQNPVYIATFRGRDQ